MLKRKKFLLSSILVCFLFSVLLGGLCFYLKMSAHKKTVFVPEEHKKKIIATVFAGRKKYMSILVPYLEKLKEAGQIDEVHFWQFTKNDEDVKYLESISNIHKTSSEFDEYRTIHPKITDNCLNLKIKAKDNCFIRINKRIEVNIERNSVSLRREGLEIASWEGNFLDPNNFVELKIKIENNKLYVGKILSTEFENSEIEIVEVHTGNGNDGYWDYEEGTNLNYSLLDSRYRTTCHWAEAYAYYLDYDFDILIKTDDDIVFIDRNRFKEFTTYIQNNSQHTCVIPNLVNHACSLFYNNKNNLIPDDILGESYKNKASPNDIFNYFKDGEEAVKIHNYFLNNISKFTENDIAPINLNECFPSICMFGINKINFMRLFSHIESDRKEFDDERYIDLQAGNMLYPRFVAFHYQFGPQMKSGLTEESLPRFKKLMEETLNSVFP
ncbi:MAG: hypothetical protein LBF33_01420 [Oscillospiraceae bacterium]|nr:hypothetical protein [Oscillospiraceae bacterium]